MHDAIWSLQRLSEQESTEATPILQIKNIDTDQGWNQSWPK